MIRRLLPLLVLIGLWTGPAGGEIVLSQDFDSGSLDVAASTVSGNTVTLVGRKTWTQPGYADYYRWFYFRADGAAGAKPTFSISTRYFLGDLFDHRFVWSYNQTDWRFFDYASLDYRTLTYTTSSAQAFSQDTVYVAYSLPYPLARTESHTRGVLASPWVAPTSSGNSALVLGQSAGGVDDLGRTIDPHDLLGYTITDPAATGAKKKVVLVGGNHSCETLGNHALEGMIDFLLSDQPDAARLRAAAEFFVYPQVNPDGREAGYYRGEPEDPSKDHNRFWNNPSGLTDVAVVREAMLRDTGGDVDYLFDFHGYFSVRQADYFQVEPAQAGSDFATALAELEPAIAERPLVGEPGMLHVWAGTALGLRAEFACAAEFGPHTGVLEDRFEEIGANYARALCRAIVAVPEPAAVVLLAGGLVPMLVVLAVRRPRRWGGAGGHSAHPVSWVGP